MDIQCKGIILRQVKIGNGKKMLSLLTDDLGKISASAYINTKGKSKSNIALLPFNLSQIYIKKMGEHYYINKGDVEKSYYKIAENVENYLACSEALELTEKLIIEDVPVRKVFDLLCEFMSIMSERKSNFDTVLIAYKINLLERLGHKPELENCVNCGAKTENVFFHSREGGIICCSCKNSLENPYENTKLTHSSKLIFELNFDIVKVLKYFLEEPLNSFKNIALDEKTAMKVKEIIRAYISQQLGVNETKSEIINQVMEVKNNG
ncbi:MAG: DNA repair protein RecO [Anaerovoracaceae bacterium]